MTIDYREAFVIDMEIASHSFECKECALAALKSKSFCLKMQHMRSIILKAYEALPPYYKDRYTAALDTTITQSNESLRDVGIVIS